MSMYGVENGQNTSGFYGYATGSIYPGWGDGDTQTLQTVPEPAEQAVMTDMDSPLPTPVDNKKATSMWMLFGALIVILFVFGRG